MQSPDQGIGQDSTFAADGAGRRREDRIVGASPTMERAIEGARTAAGTDLPVWIAGPTGTGKELLARAVHSWSPRRDHRFEVVSCASIPPSLQAREIFGCGSGVHSALPAAYPGQLRSVGPGSLLIDGVGALRPEVRSALLQALQSRRFRSEGEAQDQRLETRILFGVENGAEGRWLEGVPHHEIRLLPLSERPEDILPLAAHFLSRFAADAGLTPVGFTPEARTWLVSEEWRGNVRELRERIRQAVQLTGQGAVTAEALLLASDGEDVPSFKEAKRAFETRYVTHLLRRCNGNISRAARMAKKDRKDFYDVIRRTKVDPSQFRT